MNYIEALSKVAMTSLEVAEITGKQHSHVMRDIRNLLKQGVHESNFGLTFRINKLNNGAERKDPYYNLTPKGCLILASGYNAVLREKIINRLEEWETGERVYRTPKTFAEALRLAADQQDEIERQQRLIDEQKPKADYFDNLVNRNLLVNFTTLAKQIGVKRKELIERLLNDKYLYRDKKNSLRPYAEYNDDLFKIKDWGNDNVAGSQTLVTPKGKETFRLLYGTINMTEE